MTKKTDDVQPSDNEMPPLVGTLMFYEKPELLNKVVHARLSLKKTDQPYAFAANAHIVPLMVNEFQFAALSYPIIFAGSPRRPAVVLAVGGGRNLFIDPEKGFAPHAYAPLYVRRYPFALANDNANSQVALIIDRAASMLGEDGDMPFFQNGEPTEALRDAMKFCEDFEGSRLLTERFCEELEALDLFDVRKFEFTPRNPDGSDAPTQTVAEYFAVSEEKLLKLPLEKLGELRATGALQQIYAHLISLNGWDKLLALHIARLQEQAAAGAANQA